MQTQDTNNIESQQQHVPVEPRRISRWLAGLGAGLVVLLVIGASIVVFAMARQHPGSQPPPAGQWQQVQSGYLFLSMQAAPSNPQVLYACVTTSAAASNKGGQPDTILRSADGGAHWQNVGASAGLGSYCELAVNPTNENDIYVVSTGAVAQTDATLKHSTDGGETWTTITPTFSPPVGEPGPNAMLPWFVQQLRYDGHNLYGIQWVLTGRTTIPSPPALTNRLPRLITSSDGGHTWHVIDGQFTATRLGAQSYALDDTHPGTLYEIVGQPLFPVESVPAPTGIVSPIFGINEQLYKSTDGGASWLPLLSGLPFNSQVQIASANPQIVYVGGILGPMPLVPRLQPGQPVIPASVFHLQVSTNGGASWQQVAAPSDEELIQSWLVSADGSVYTSPTISSGSPGVGATPVEGTPIIGTAVPATPLTGGLPDIQAASPASQPEILRYDLASHTWNKVTIPPISGNLLQVTPAGTNGGTLLWYAGLQGTQYTLYRYRV